MSATFFENRHISKGGPLQTQTFDVFKFQNGFVHCIGLDFAVAKNGIICRDWILLTRI